jgi:hypothetical protein
MQDLICIFHLHEMGAYSEGWGAQSDVMTRAPPATDGGGVIGWCRFQSVTSENLVADCGMPGGDDGYGWCGATG